MGREKNLNRTSIEATSRRKRRLSGRLTLFVLGTVIVLVSLRAFQAAGLHRPEESSNLEAAPRPAHRFEPTNINVADAPQPVPDGMVWIPGGEFSMGANDPPDMDEIGMKAIADARPIHRVYVDGFYMDKTDVTNAQFTRFVRATGYVTVAERTPRAEDFPGAPRKNLVAGGVVSCRPIIRFR